MSADARLALGGVTVLEAGPRHCRWPIGDPQADSFRFCGRARSSIAGTWYCEDHAKRAWAQWPPRSHLSPSERRAQGL